MNEIRTITLRFESPTARRFDEYARRKGYSVGWSNDGHWQKATVIFGNGSDKRKFMSGWASESLEIA